MKEFKGTKGTWLQCGDGKFRMSIDRRLGDSGLKTIGTINTLASVEETKANAQLIADAGNVRQQINCDLPELLRQRNEMLKHLESLSDMVIRKCNLNNDSNLKELFQEVQKSKQLIKEVES